jgi:hypothetical protein
MKILDIITPHETLDENAFTDLVAKGKSAARDVANTVGEYTGIRALRTRESNKIADYVDEALTKAGKDLNRSEGLAAAERSLLDVEKTISLEGLTKKRFDQFAEYLATECKKEDRLLSSQESPILTLKELIKKDPKPPAWATSKQLNSNLFNNEYNDWLIANVNARVKIKQEVELAKTAPPAPKTKAEKEADKLADKEKTVANKELDARGLDADVKIETAKKTLVQIANDSKAATAVGRWWNSLSTLDKGFFSAEAIRIIIVNGQRLKDISEWRQSGNIPSEVARYFPKVESPGTETVGGPAKQTVYATNEQRVNAAANYAEFTIYRQGLLQLGGLGGGLLAGNALVKLGGGTINYASQIKIIVAGLAPLGKGIVRLVEKIPSKYGGGTWITTSGSWISKLTVEGLKGISQAGKLMMIDYFISAVNPSQPFVSAPLTDLSNKLSTLSPYKNLQIDHPPDINAAVLSILTISMWSSIEGFSTSPFVKQMIGTYEASLVPVKLFLDTIGMILDVAGVDVPDIDVSLPPAGGKLPGVDNTNSGSNTQPVVPQSPAPPVSDTNAQQDQGALSGDQSTSTNTSPAVVKPEAKPPANARKGKVTPSDNGYLPDSINESLKKRVAQLMKS